jgi:alkylation response protein AidB-like acyl-CoA dehydrogenase
MDIMGPDGLAPSGRMPLTVFGPDDASPPHSSGAWATIFLNARAGTIYAGSSQVQRNIIGERVLGLPKEP